MITHYYIEKDGRVFLLDKGGRLSFPTDKKEIPFEFRELRVMPFEGVRVVYCEPLIPFPKEWKASEDVIQKDNVDPLVRKAMWKAKAMLGVDAIIMKAGKVLAMKPSRGWGQGYWKLPGGVVSYGETPEESLEREVREEVGLKVKSSKLVAILKKVFPESEMCFTCFVYLCEVGGEIRPAEDEVEKIAWMGPKELMEKTGSPFVRFGLEEFLKEPGEIRVIDLD